ncbi:hypothetical protein [Candidatus Ichthyocystis sparus]|nr:hypothetical protein [Candidatus Ichthyocystis sparus]
MLGRLRARESRVKNSREEGIAEEKIMESMVRNENDRYSGGSRK